MSAGKTQEENLQYILLPLFGEGGYLMPFLGGVFYDCPAAVQAPNDMYDWFFDRLE